MAVQSRLDFILQITHFFHGHWEDPEWGKLPVNQVLIGVAIRELAAGILDKEIKGQINTAVDKTIAKNSQAIAK